LNALIAYDVRNELAALSSPKPTFVCKEIEQFGQNHFRGNDDRIADRFFDLLCPSVIIVPFVDPSNPKPSVGKILRRHYRR
jgi:hypothetical protein